LNRLCSNKDYDEYINTQHVTEVLQMIISNEQTSEFHEKNLYFSIYTLLNLDNLKSIMYIYQQSKLER
jgi:hypothetical protein